MNEFVLAVVLVVVGWLLGVLSPAMIELIRRQRDYPLLQRAIRADLVELRVTLAFTAISLKTAQGKIDRQLLEWQRDILTSYQGKQDFKELLTHTNTMLAASDADLEKVAALHATGRPGGHGLKTFSAPTISALLPTLWQLPAGLQAELLEINQELSRLNEEVEYAKYYFRLTFENVSSNNHSIAKANLMAAYMNIADMAMRVVKKIEQVAHL